MSHPAAKLLALSVLCVLLGAPSAAQRSLAGAEKTRLALERLNVLAGALVIAAHPDDENTALLAYLSRGRKCRTAYLSLTRGEGGQNLIGPEQGDLLGIIRTQELLAARGIDGAEQHFTRAIDFGFSKSPVEALSKWGRDAVLSDVVWNIRKLRPDVIVCIFTGTSRDGHGQHQASAILAKEAFSAAADPARFPEQLRWVESWRARRLLWNVFFWMSDEERKTLHLEDTVAMDLGAFDPALGFSYNEIAGMSRSMHRSQGMGVPEWRGSMKNVLAPVAGEKAEKDLFDGVDTTWARVPGGAAVGGILGEAARQFDFQQPEKTIPLLLKARPLISALKDPWAARKLAELDETLVLLSGLWLDASAERAAVTPGASFKVDVTAINRSRFPITLEKVSIEGMPAQAPAGEGPALLTYNQPARRSFTLTVPQDQPYSQPYWLARPRQASRYSIDDQTLIGLPEPPPPVSARFRLAFDTQVVEITRPVAHRYVDRIEGERVRPLVVAPPVAVRISEPVRIFPDAQPRTLEVLLTSGLAGVSGDVRLELPAAWKAEPASRAFRISDAGETAGVSFVVTPPSAAASAEIQAAATVDGRRIASGMTVIAYPHLVPQTVFPPARAELVRFDVSVLARRVGYVMGAGDEIPESLRQLGIEVTLLSQDDLARGDLSRFDAIVTGVRAFNVRPELASNHERLMEYARQGGTVVVQYNVLGYGEGPSSLGKLGPYPLTIGRARVSVEEAPVAFLNPGSPLLQSPNRITEEDFREWVQERGLYFASSWDSRYEPLFECHDPEEAPQKGATLVARCGKGAYVFTAFSWFRQLPAGVPGAWRIFANLLSAGRTLP